MSVEKVIQRILYAMLERNPSHSLNKSFATVSKLENREPDDLYPLNHTWAPHVGNDTSDSTWKMHLRAYSRQIEDLMDDSDSTSTSTRDSVVIFFYSLIVIVSIFGNLLVCRVVFRRTAMRSTTNLFIANLSVSDLLLTIFNIPFNVARLLLDNWPFGVFLCSSLPFIQVMSVYVAAFTMACIALDRYQVIAYPFTPRVGSYTARVKITFIWIAAIFLSIPYPMFNDVVDEFTYRPLHLCRVVYPEPAQKYRMWITSLSLLTQYILPLTITGIAYAKIVSLLWYRKVVGAVTENQRLSQQRSKWKSIKMLMIVVVVFAICWFPLNLYHAYHDLNRDVGPTKHKSNVFLICHWMAMSSVCYNPFIYCWLNDTFRAVARSHFRFICKVVKGQRNFVTSPTVNELRHRRYEGSFFRFGKKWRYAWFNKPSAKSSTTRTTSSSVRSYDSPSNSFLFSSQRSPNSTMTFCPLEDLSGKPNGRIIPSVKRINVSFRPWTSLEFVSKHNPSNVRRNSAEIKGSFAFGNIIGTQV